MFLCRLYTSPWREEVFAVILSSSPCQGEEELLFNFTSLCYGEVVSLSVFTSPQYGEEDYWPEQSSPYNEEDTACAGFTSP